MRSRYRLNKIAAVAIVAFGALGILAILRAQTSRSLWDGVYTQEQAQRGATIYAGRCARCHGAELGGGDSVPPLAGTEFLSTWNTLTVGDLFDRIRASMPSDKPGSLTRQQGSDIVAYILSVNKFPAGNTELGTQTELLKQIEFDAFKQQALSEDGMPKRFLRGNGMRSSAPAMTKHSGL